jgi:hypothetical protein
MESCASRAAGVGAVERLIAKQGADVRLPELF